MPLSPQMFPLFQRVDMARLFPPFAELAIDLVQRCYERGTGYYAISGFRSVEEQDRLYRMGRSEEAPGHWRVTDKSQVRTNARGGASAHNFGLAIDFARDRDMERDGLQPGWHSHEYDVLASEAAKLGLESGHLYASLKDSPHIQLDLGRFCVTTRHLETLHQKGGIPEVWDFLACFDWRAKR